MTYYEVLGVSREATEAEIRHAYYRLAQQLHPDRHPDAVAAERDRLEDRMAQVNAAWAVLEDADSRRGYDAALSRHGPLKAAVRPRRRTPTGAPRPIPHPPETPPQLLRRQYFVELARPWTEELVIVADVYGRASPVDPLRGRLSLLAFAAVKAVALYRTMLLVLTPSTVLLLAVRSRWSGWKVKERIGAWPRSEVKAEPIEPDLSVRIHLPGRASLELSPLWVTPEAAEIRRALTAS